MNNKIKSVLAGATAALMLLGGTSYALWSVSQPVTGGTITAGNLDLAVAPMEFFDISQDRSDATDPTNVDGILGHAIDLSTWRAVPGDTVLGVFPIDLALLGDNMKAALTVAQADGTPLTAGPGWSIEYAAAQPDGTLVSPWGASFSSIEFVSADNGNNVSALPVADNVIAAPAAAEYRVAVRVVFDPALANQEQVNATQALSGLQVGLAQVRTTNGAGGYN